METDIKPRSVEALKRAHTIGAPDHVVLFGGPDNLIRLAHVLANNCRPEAERLICHPEDYKAAGLRRFGPEAYIEIMQGPDRPTAFRPFDPSAIPERRQAALRPVEGCPRGEVWVDLSDPGRRKRAGL